ncbi:MAG: type II toxin-antitoxin system RelE/ParE family toxin [Bacteroidia bacterium]|nr:type II toxin-antitoxin system RelE/ParE family toxin [Bacteroidia bacterium]
MKKLNFNIEFLPEAAEFINMTDVKAREKILYNMKKAQYMSNQELFKKLNNVIWEFRTLYNGQAYRLFAFWDKVNDSDTLVIATHGIVKKTQKAQIQEIHKAMNIRSRYMQVKGTL